MSIPTEVILTQATFEIAPAYLTRTEQMEQI